MAVNGLQWFVMICNGLQPFRCGIAQRSLLKTLLHCVGRSLAIVAVWVSGRSKKHHGLQVHFAALTVSPA
jgi:hypothetical protein